MDLKTSEVAHLRIAFKSVETATSHLLPLHLEDGYDWKMHKIMMGRFIMHAPVRHTEYPVLFVTCVNKKTAEGMGQDQDAV